MNVRPPYRYIDPVVGTTTRVFTDDRGFVQISVAPATDSTRVVATRIRDKALDELIAELVAARGVLAGLAAGPGGEMRYPADRPGWLGQYQPWPCGRCGHNADDSEPHPCAPVAPASAEAAEVPPEDRPDWREDALGPYDARTARALTLSKACGPHCIDGYCCGDRAAPQIVQDAPPTPTRAPTPETPGAPNVAGGVTVPDEMIEAFIRGAMAEYGPNSQDAEVRAMRAKPGAWDNARRGLAAALEHFLHERVEAVSVPDDGRVGGVTSPGRRGWWSWPRSSRRAG